MAADNTKGIKRVIRNPLFLGLISFVCCFLVGIMLFLPLEPFARQLEQKLAAQGLDLQIDRPELLFPLGLEAGQIDLKHKQIPHPPITLRDVRVTPVWMSLPGSNQGVNFKLQTHQGQVAGSVYRDGNLELKLTELQFKETLSPQLPLSLRGRIVNGIFAGVVPLAGKNTSKLTLNVEDLTLTGLQKLGSDEDQLPLGTLSLAAAAKGPVVQLTEIRLTGSSLDLKGSGTLRLGRNPASSSINLSLVLTPKASLDPALKDLLSLVKQPQPNGSYQLRLSGPISNPRIN